MDTMNILITMEFNIKKISNELETKIFISLWKWAIFWIGELKKYLITQSSSVGSCIIGWTW